MLISLLDVSPAVSLQDGRVDSVHSTSHAHMALARLQREQDVRLRSSRLRGVAGVVFLGPSGPRSCVFGGEQQRSSRRNVFEVNPPKPEKETCSFATETSRRSTHIFTPTSLLEQLKAMNKPDEEVTS
ncbi:unnamed protein product [Pleuronectes platessa]|uniref:Uncharacterized protein n=1 Tax=Pleuronectes platessa TaxID=8262 RepID=A0A9N7YML4_PLEPL|nr:unnamed protein product [Pleuronectes platessa]